ncbi:hypothetical protein [Silvibacterium dinghuense]|uniref:Uncharacterized protein n=1 Tax=Silvibacterium dinghuense TaxID=1560006 RepID=A0A4Q1SBP2_9BACT|nr:hypothetical protein [Silvibacterium dinghuense]RXS94558.1 hypothetical protein ESZ00_15970 [Silvibacterium dinghuense]GGH15370.1 hypothetical protein GCM10011586_36400 [Silvibacterium dinghuense]
MTDFYDANALQQVAINLFYGWGYNFYRTENQLRADDQLVRAKVSWLLGRARAAVEAGEVQWRREKLPPPSRAHPFPDAEAVAGAQALELLAREIGRLKGQIENLPVPENDRMTQRYRQEAATLEALALQDALLVGQADLLCARAEGGDGAALIASKSELQQGLKAISETLHQRESLLHAKLG